MHQVAIVAYPGCWGQSVFAAIDFFRVVALLEQHLQQTPHWQVYMLSPDGLPVTLASGHVLTCDGSLSETPFDLVVIAAMAGPQLANTAIDVLGSWVAKQLRTGSQVLSLTTGAAVLATCGCADGQTLATHWAYVRQLSKRYECCNFVAHPSFLHQGQLYSTSSLQGCFDALLDYLARHSSDGFAHLCAAHLLVADPAQLRPILPGFRNHQDAAILQLQAWIEQNYAERLTLAHMAAYCHLSERTLKRRFQHATGISANTYLQQVRIDKTKKLLLATSLSVKEIAYQVGYENTGFLIRLFREATGETPSIWRKVADQPPVYSTRRPVIPNQYR